ncbi:transposase [Nostoc carneum NIES-2107]|nr:transposase [Nostoc carneum NIES-2107]
MGIVLRESIVAGDGEPGVKTIWLRLRRLHDIAATWKLLHPDSPLTSK